MQVGDGPETGGVERQRDEAHPRHPEEVRPPGAQGDAIVRIVFPPAPHAPQGQIEEGHRRHRLGEVGDGGVGEENGQKGQCPQEQRLAQRRSVQGLPHRTVALSSSARTAERGAASESVRRCSTTTPSSLPVLSSTRLPGGKRKETASQGPPPAGT